MAYTRGQRLEVTVRGAPLYGFVETAARGMVSFVADDGRLFKPQPEGVFRPSNHPVPEGVEPPRTWAKGDRVSFAGPDGALDGTVKTAGQSTVVVVTDGGLTETRGPHSAYAPSKKPLPTHEPSHMDAWSVRAYKPVPTLSRETTAYTASVCLDGKPVIEASNDGCGGADMFRPLRGHGHEIVSRFERDAAKWLVDAGKKGRVFEAGADFVNWFCERRPYACTAKDYVESRESALETAALSANAAEEAEAATEAGLGR